MSKRIYLTSSLSQILGLSDGLCKGIEIMGAEARQQGITDVLKRIHCLADESLKILHDIPISEDEK